MIPIHIFGVLQGLYLCLLLQTCVGDDEICDRRPLGTKTAPLPPDNRFFIDVDTLGDLYIPNRQYRVRLYSRDNSSSFMGFTMSIREDTADNERNPRKPKHLDPGLLVPSPDNDAAKVHPKCKNTVIEADVIPKTFVEAHWTAPYKGNKCVTIYAVVAVKPDVWYSFEGPLSKRVCEDRRKAEDMQPMENDNCQACEEARYQVTFEGMWTYNTHPQMFPKAIELARFSDVVGASHNRYFNLYKNNAEASEGLKMLAEQGNTTKLELEIQSELGKNVRTIIKASNPAKTVDTTTASFRTSPEHHLVSLTTALLPSPDWFLGVSNMELCDVTTGNWTNSVILNLYPMDAGTDSGQTFESPNEETSPPQPISSVIVKDVIMEQMKPLARLKFDLVRTYSTPKCAAATTASPGDEEEEEDNGNDIEKPTRVRVPTTPKIEEPVTPDPASSDNCPMTAWEEWMPCEGECVDGKRTGFQIRFRHHMVGNVVVKDVIQGSGRANEIPRECLDESTNDFQECEEDCVDEETEAPEAQDEAEAQSRIWENLSKWDKKK
ncbi:spondin-1 [Aphomia sociella]